MPIRSLRPALTRRKFITAPGVFDLISALVADRMGFEALYITGYGTVASSLGLPDAGLATYTEMLERISRIVAMTKTPVIADADTGYGGLLNVRHTVRGYEAAGVAAIQLEDQEFPKKCGHTPNRRVIPTSDMVRKIRVAADARSSEDFLIIARTDARTSLGLNEAIARCVAYAEAGADVIFIESPETEQEFVEIARHVSAPLLANLVNGGRTPMTPAGRLAEIGYSIAIFPVVGFLAATKAMQTAYQDILDNGTTTDPSLVYPFAEFNKLIGFEDIWEFEKRYAEIPT